MRHHGHKSVGSSAFRVRRILRIASHRTHMNPKSIIPAVTTPVEGDFKGHPVMTFPNPDDPKEPGIQMGIKKLRAILPHIALVQGFVDKHHKPKTKTVPVEKAKELEDENAKLKALVAKLTAEATTTTDEP